MADKEDQVIGGEEEAQEATEDKGSISYRMEHPEEEAVLEPKTQEETAEEQAAREAAEKEEAGKPAVQEEEPPPDSPEGRIKAAQAKMHEATGETAKERKAREAAESRAEAAEKERDDLKKQLEVAAKPLEKEEKPVKPSAKTEEEQDAIFAAASEEIGQLETPQDWDTDGKREYHKEAGKIWRKAIAAAGDNRSLPDPDQLAEDTANRAWEKIQARQEAAKVAKAKEDSDTAAARAWESALDAGEKAGLSVLDKKSADSIVFHAVERELPEEYYGKPKEATEWIIAETRTRLGKVVEQTEAEKAAAKAAQKRNTVLGKGGGAPPAKEPFKPRTMSEMF